MLSIELLHKEYMLGGTIYGLSKKYNYPETSLRRNFLRNSFFIRETKIGFVKNENFFECIDNEEKAYFLGYLFADGCVFVPKKGKPRLVLHAHEQDIDIIEKFKLIIGASHNINRWKKYVRLCIHSDKIVCDLMNLGVVSKKTFVVVPPNLDKSLMIHFWRGVVDGDGWVSYTDRIGESRVPLIGICGTKKICEGFSKDIFGGKVSVCKVKNSYKVQCSHKSARIAMRLLWEYANIFGERKKQKVLQWIQV